MKTTVIRFRTVDGGELRVVLNDEDATTYAVAQAVLDTVSTSMTP